MTVGRRTERCTDEFRTKQNARSARGNRDKSADGDTELQQ